MIEITTEAKPFPKLMKGKIIGSIVFFIEPNKGLSIEEGIWYEGWGMEIFEDHNEAITIKNK